MTPAPGKQTYRYECGHDGRDFPLTVKSKGLSKCPQCRSAEFIAKEYESNRALSSQHGFTPLSGTEKQIRWAITLRAECWKQFESYLAQARVDAARGALPLGMLQSVETIRTLLFYPGSLQPSLQSRTASMAAFWISFCKGNRAAAFERLFKLMFNYVWDFENSRPKNSVEGFDLLQSSVEAAAFAEKGKT